MISRQKCVMHIHTSKRKFGYDMCIAPDILINLRFIVSNLCTKSIIDANYGILSRLSRSDRFFKVNHVVQNIEISNFQTLKKLFYGNNFSVPDFLWCCKKPRKVKFSHFFIISFWPDFLTKLIAYLKSRTTETQWRHKSKKSENLCQCGRQNILRPHLNI